jgi:hypothetical protein
MMESSPTHEDKNTYVLPEMYELGDVAELTQGGGSDCIEASGDFKMVGCNS